ncbi:hypothetical protein [Bacillus sp. PS06]|uniref:hypothetical protein n=1 Tax=Bacillus sp. PS06 TaxID=2764176 RepID=UPI001786D4CF|nr:hypothetical protein [Bacillus sp. PS06]MBD8069724.1 hypothetical protein [Bacillus sp. PS06]
MKKVAGIAIIIFSLLIALGCALSFRNDLVFANFLLWLISFPLYILGQIMRTSKAEFKYRGKRWVLIYIFFFFILPLILNLQQGYTDLKKSTFIDEQFILFEFSSGSLGEWSVLLFMILIILFALRFLSPEIKRKGLLNTIIAGMVLFVVGFNYVMFNDYRGVHEEQGLVSSNWNGEKEMISFGEIESIHIKPYTHFANLNLPSDETRFAWELIFQPTHLENEIYHFSFMTEENLEEMIDIAAIAREYEIPFNVGEMDQTTLNWFEFDLDLEGLDDERYYELFQVNK